MRQLLNTPTHTMNTILTALPTTGTIQRDLNPSAHQTVGGDMSVMIR